MAAIKYIVNGEVAVEISGSDLEDISPIAEAALLTKYPQLGDDDPTEVEVVSMTIEIKLPVTAEAVPVEADHACQP